MLCLILYSVIVLFYLSFFFEGVDKIKKDVIFVFMYICYKEDFVEVFYKLRYIFDLVLVLKNNKIKIFNYNFIIIIRRIRLWLCSYYKII